MTVSYTAACPACGSDATWMAWSELVVVGRNRHGDPVSSEVTSHRVDCQECS